MKPEQQRIAIAEACGWADCQIIGNTRWFGIPPEQANTGDNFRLIPDYLADLNAMHEAVIGLNDAQFHTYTLILNNIGWAAYPGQYDADYKKRLRVFCAPSAEQSAEALLRAIGKWEERP